MFTGLSSVRNGSRGLSAKAVRWCWQELAPDQDRPVSSLTLTTLLYLVILPHTIIPAVPVGSQLHYLHTWGSVAFLFSLMTFFVTFGEVWLFCGIWLAFSFFSYDIFHDIWRSVAFLSQHFSWHLVDIFQHLLLNQNTLLWHFYNHLT